MTSLSPILNALTVDVEDYFQVSAFEDQVERSQWSSYPSRVVDSTHRLLDLFDRHHTKATFFVLGWTAREFPQLVEEIHQRGHELGSHSFWHRLVYDQSPEDFRRDLCDSMKAIEDASGERVKCYRAPSFSITKRSVWALRILVEEGIQIDSSIYPIYHDRYGIPGSELGIHQRETTSGSIIEFPPAVLETRLWNIPVSGGGYFRLYPGWLTARCIRKINQIDRPVMFYCHPWEVDPAQPKVPSRSKTRSWRHRVNLKTTCPKLSHLLSCFRFGTISESIREATNLLSTPFPDREHGSAEVAS